jgi:putative SOS response-associated peptidase YedK
MCGRYQNSISAEELIAVFQVVREFDIGKPRYNIAPTQPVVTVRQTDEGRIAEWRRWGLVPSWSKDPKAGPPLINARAETAAEKPPFRAAIKTGRCLVPASGFYEWETVGREKLPWHIRSASGEPLAFAGLYEHWGEGAAAIESCAILTTSANAVMAELSDRMPVILPRDVWDVWLDAQIQDAKAVCLLLVPAADDLLIKSRVGKTVNNARNETPACLAPPERDLFDE